MPDLLEEEVTAVYAGLRAATEHDDYAIRSHPAQGYVTVGGIRSTGLTASMAIAAYVVELLTEAGAGVGTAGELPPLTMPNLGEARARPYQRADLIAADPAYGALVCHCERVSRGRSGTRSPPTSRPRRPRGCAERTRALGGRCQGFYCGAELRALFDAPGTEAAR